MNAIQLRSRIRSHEHDIRESDRGAESSSDSLICSPRARAGRQKSAAIAIWAAVRHNWRVLSRFISRMERLAAADWMPGSENLPEALCHCKGCERDADSSIQGSCRVASSGKLCSSADSSPRAVEGPIYRRYSADEALQRDLRVSRWLEYADNSRAGIGTMETLVRNRRSGESCPMN